MGIGEFIETILAPAEEMEHLEVIPARGPQYGDLQHSLSPPLKTYLHTQYIRLFTHQAEAIDTILAGKNVIITTPTASGKTLSFNLPVFDMLHREEEATALYVYPMKALANDQLNVLLQLEKATGIKMLSSIYDGDTPPRARAKIRERSRIVLTNPYALHQYLPWHQKWARFFQYLKIVVIDEAHTYRGVFGSNVAMLLRRLRRICNHYGSNPQFVLSSATLANPEELSQKLVGNDFEVVSEDGSGRGKKFFLFWNPPFLDEIEFVRRSPHQETVDLLTAHLEHGFQTLCFTVSRKTAELVATWAREKIEEKLPDLAAKIATYRAGYLPEERRQIEKRLREGDLRGVVSTVALEVGIDIGSLDSVIISGYPGTIISTWQQAGRSGRGIEDSVAVLVAFDGPLDQYIMKHPQRFFGTSPEHAIVDLENPYILMGHVMCASAELPLVKDDEKYFGSQLSSVLKGLVKENVLSRTHKGWVYSGLARSAEVVNLNSISDRTVSVWCNGELLETMDFVQANREAYPGAVILHQGETFVVRELDFMSMTATAEQKQVDYYTEAKELTEIDIVKPIRLKNPRIGLSVGEVKVTEHHPSYQLKRYDRVIEHRPLNLRPVDFESVGMWFTIPSDLENEVRRTGSHFAGGLHAVEHGMIAMAPLYAMCDQWDLGGMSTPLHTDTGKPTIFIYDAFEGGIGIAEKCHELFDELVQATLELIRDCECKAGCPSCIYSPKCGDDNQPLDKKAALIILKGLKQ